MPDKKDVPIVKAGDVTQRVGVEVIRARGVDVEKLIKMLIANAAAEFASTCLPAPITTTRFSECISPGMRTTRRSARMRDLRTVPIGS
jgi:hypothetical protein